MQVLTVDTPSTDALPGAIDRFRRQGVQVVLGSNASELSASAGQIAFDHGMVFWETGAVGEMSGDASGRLAFKVAPSGLVLGSSGIAFIADQMAERLHRDPSTLRFVVVNVDRPVRHPPSPTARSGRSPSATCSSPGGSGTTVDGLRPGGAGPADRRGRARTCCSWPSYIPDGVALNRELVRPAGAAPGEHRHVVELLHAGSSATSSAPIAVGTFATDKPDGGVLNEQGLTAEGRRPAAPGRGRVPGAVPRRHERAGAGRVLGGVGAVPRRHAGGRRRSTRTSIADAALAVRLPMGTLPNGSGLEFARPGTRTSRARTSARAQRHLGVGRRPRAGGRVAAPVRDDRPSGPSRSRHERAGTGPCRLVDAAPGGGLRARRGRARRVRRRGVAFGVAQPDGPPAPAGRRPVSNPPYRWVNPPPALADQNKPPALRRLHHHVRRGAVRRRACSARTTSRPRSCSRSRGRLRRIPGADSVHMTITPLDPATLGAPRRPDRARKRLPGHGRPTAGRRGRRRLREVGPGGLQLPRPLEHGNRALDVFGPDGTTGRSPKTTTTPPGSRRPPPRTSSTGTTRWRRPARSRPARRWAAGPVRPCRGS